jgi:pentapeptide MXKDX repeat protein
MIILMNSDEKTELIKNMNNDNMNNDNINNDNMNNDIINNDNMNNDNINNDNMNNDNINNDNINNDNINNDNINNDNQNDENIINPTNEDDKSKEDNQSKKNQLSKEDDESKKDNNEEHNKIKQILDDYDYGKEIKEKIDDIDLYGEDININVDRLKNMLKQKSINYKKKFYLIHIQKKINVLSYKIRFINHKYTDYLLYYKHFNVLVILFSSILTLFEAFTNMINIEEIENDVLRLNLKFIPLILSTIISLLATYIRFQKYQEKMEELSLTEEKSKLAISKLKNIREYLTIKEEINFNYIEELYFNEIYRYYNDVSVKISIMLDDNDYNKYSKKINQNDIKKEAIIIKKNRELHDIVEKQTSLIDTLSKSNKDLMKNENSELISELKTTMDDCNKYIGESHKNNEKHHGICAQSPK